MTEVSTAPRPAVAEVDASVEETVHPRFRGDIEGLRAVAVGLVLLYHAGLPFLPGGFVGVDVFFVISGFLITGQLLKEVRRTGRVSLVRFYARRAKRLLPATAVVLVATVGMVLAFVPRIRWSDIGGDVVAAALYVVNWRFAQQSVDYLAEDVEESPVQHFWSLAVEEQYYVVWPLLVLALTWWAHRIGRSGQPRAHHLWIGLGVVAVPSFAWSVFYTQHSPAAAFFVTTTRMWELAAGAAVAIGAVALAGMPRRVAVALGWAGLAAIAVAGLRYTAEMAWPGYAAALPVLGAAAVIATGPAAGSRGPVALLGTRPFVWVGALSYSLYLWHWPLIIVATAALGGLSLPVGLLVAALSVVPAWLSYRFVESPLRYSRAVSRSPRLALSLGANFTLVGVVAGLVLVLAVPAGGSAVPASAVKGAAVLGSAGGQAKAGADEPAPGEGAPSDTAEFITPDPFEATKDVPDLYAEGCQVAQPDVEVVTCAYGPEDAATTIAVVGDSKVAQWVPALQAVADDEDWRIETFTKSACSFSDAEIRFQGDPYVQCTEWNQRVLDRLLEERPDYVVTSQGRPAGSLEPGGQPSVAGMVEGLRSRWQALEDAGIGVVVIGDTPQPGFQVYECVAENRDRLTECTFDRDPALARTAAPTLAKAVEGSDAALVDMTDYVCPTEVCAPVIGNVLVYRQGSHVTKTYVETLAPVLRDALEDAFAR